MTVAYDFSRGPRQAVGIRLVGAGWLASYDPDGGDPAVA